MSSVGGGPITQCECPQCNKLAIITIMTNHATPIPDQFVCLPGMKHSSTAAYCLSNPTGFTAAIGGRSKTTIEKHHKRCLGRREPSQVHHATSPRSPTRTTVSQLIQHQFVRTEEEEGNATNSTHKPTALPPGRQWFCDPLVNRRPTHVTTHADTTISTYSNELRPCIIANR